MTRLCRQEWELLSHLITFRPVESVRMEAQHEDVLRSEMLLLCLRMLEGDARLVHSFEALRADVERLGLLHRKKTFRALCPAVAWQTRAPRRRGGKREHLAPPYGPYA